MKDWGRPKVLKRKNKIHGTNLTVTVVTVTTVNKTGWYWQRNTYLD